MFSSHERQFYVISTGNNYCALDGICLKSSHLSQRKADFTELFIRNYLLYIDLHIIKFELLTHAKGSSLYSVNFVITVFLINNAN